MIESHMGVAPARIFFLKMMCLDLLLSFLLFAVSSFASLIPTETSEEEEGWTMVTDNPVDEYLGSFYFNSYYDGSEPQAKDFSKDQWFDLMVYYNNRFGPENVKIDRNDLDNAQKMGSLTFSYDETQKAVYFRGFYLEVLCRLEKVNIVRQI